MTYSLDFRKKVLSIRSREKLSFSQAAERFGVSVNSIFLWSNRLEPRRTKNRPAIRIYRENLMEDIKKHPDAFNYERAHRLNVSTSGIYCAMKRLRISYKKNSQSSQGLRRKKTNFSRKDLKI
jgi:transposase